jgi:CRP-like cAMP-binding protein
MNKEYYDIIRNLFLFHGVDINIIDNAVAGNGFYIKKYGNGDIIYEPLYFERSLGIILDGSARVRTADMNKNITLKTINAGNVFGAASLFGNENEYVSKITAKGATTAAFFTQAAITDIIKADSRAALNYICFLSDRIRFLNRKIASFTAGSAECRLARYIIGLSETSGNISLNPGISQTAASLDIGRASFYRALDSLQSSGCIRRDGRRIYILSREKLNNIIKQEGN